MEESKSIIDDLEKEALALADSRSKEAILIALNKINNRSDPEVLKLLSRARDLIIEYINLKTLLTKANRRDRFGYEFNFSEYYNCVDLKHKHIEPTHVIKSRIRYVKGERNIIEKEIFDKTGIIYKNLFNKKR